MGVQQMCLALTRRRYDYRYNKRNMKYKGETGILWKASFAHSYSVGSFLPGVKGRHDCLRKGYWCWLNFKQHPLDIFKYFEAKS